MKVQLGSMEINDEQRRLLKRWMGERGMATREDCRVLAHDWLATLIHEICQEAQSMPPLPRKRRGGAR